MRKRKQQVMEKNLIVSRSKKKRRPRYGGGKQYFDMIPVDLVINEIFPRLSVKSMGKSRCVSKLWSSISRPPNYKQLFPTKSPDPTRLLFTLAVEEKLFFYTSIEPQNPDENSSLVATHHHRTDSAFSQVSRSVHGLVCYQRLTRDKCIQVVVLNPITGQYVALPKMAKEVNYAKSYLGYDPIDKQFKVLCISLVLRGTMEMCHEQQVVKLENQRRNFLWRKIECGIPLYDLSDDGICINGVLYYKSGGKEEPMICCFDVRSERLDFISGERRLTLVNYKGKLGAVDNRGENDFVLWVLENSEQHIWSKHVYEKPLQWRWELCSKRVYAAGVTSTGEIVFSPRDEIDAKVPFYIYYYNLERNIVVRVGVQVPTFNGFRWFKLYTFPNYVEDVKLI